MLCKSLLQPGYIYGFSPNRADAGGPSRHAGQSAAALAGTESDDLRADTLSP
jgi:hypothetical protein